MDAPLTIPAADEIRAQIRARVDELRALRQMLRLAEAARVAQSARARQRSLASPEEGARHG
jgi:hypothetical protein